MDTLIKGGFQYELEHIGRDGRVISAERCHNLTPDEGLNHVMSVMFAASPQVSSWYIGLYEGNYSPTDDVTAAALPGLATECTAYGGTFRKDFTPGAVVSGTVDNEASKAEFVFSASKRIYGGFMSSSNIKGGTTGVLISVVRFPSPKDLDTGETLRIRAGGVLLSL